MIRNKNVLFLSILFCFLVKGLSAQIKLSEKSKISLLTCASGDELYSIFGHSAIWVNDPNNNIDAVFNYGTFDFNTPNFYLKFGNGQLDYMLSINNYKSFIRAYFHENRSVVENELNITLSERQKLFNALYINSQPENKYYRYDFFFDNCATKIRDIIWSCVEGEVILPKSEQTNTFRNQLRDHLKKSPWLDLGLWLILGQPADYHATLSESMFLPVYLQKGFKTVQIKRANSTEALVKKDNKLLNLNLNINDSIIHPLTFFWVIFLISVLIFFNELKRKKVLFGFNRLILGISGLAGIVFLYLWLVTDHTVTGPNLNVLWACPFYFGYLLFTKNVIQKYHIIFVTLPLIIITLFAILNRFLHQTFPDEVLPIGATIVLRHISFLKHSNRAT